MDRFKKAVETVLKHEGGYASHPDDPGGETKYGICKRSYPHLDIKRLTREQAKEIYRRDWWDKYGYERINDDALCFKVFDLAVNMGAHQAHKLLQRAVNDVSGRLLEDDGILGPRTISAVNAIVPELVLDALLKRAESYYRSLNKPQFLAGWLNRLYDKA